MINYCAIDGGNSGIKIVIDGKKYDRVFTSIQGDHAAAVENYNNTMYLQGMSRQLWDKLHVETVLNEDNPKITTTSEFLFDKIAESFDKNLRGRSNTEKHKDMDLIKWMITSLSYALLDKKIKEEDYEIKENANLQFNVVLGVGLPYREGVDEKKREVWGNAFKGVHRINFKHPNFKNLTVELIVERVRSLVEGELSLLRELYKPNGICDSHENHELVGKKFGNIDIGGYTTEFITMGIDYKETDGYDEYAEDESDDEIEIRTLAHLTSGFNKGIKSIMDNMIARITREYVEEKGKPLRELSARDIELAFTRRGRGPGGKRGYIKPEDIYIKDIFNEEAEKLATEIVQKAYSLYSDSISEVDTIFICGGGAMHDSITSIIKERLGMYGLTDNRVMRIFEPIFANALGYYNVLTMIEEDAPELEI